MNVYIYKIIWWNDASVQIRENKNQTYLTYRARVLLIRNYLWSRLPAITFDYNSINDVKIAIKSGYAVTQNAAFYHIIRRLSCNRYCVSNKFRTQCIVILYEIQRKPRHKHFIFVWVSFSDFVQEPKLSIKYCPALISKI